MVFEISSSCVRDQGAQMCPYLNSSLRFTRLIIGCQSFCNILQSLKSDLNDCECDVNIVGLSSSCS